MNISQAMSQGITRVRLPIWNEKAYLKLRVVGGYYSPWATLYDEPGQMALEIPVGSQQVMIIGLEEDTYEEYTGEIYPGG